MIEKSPVRSDAYFPDVFKAISIGVGSFLVNHTRTRYNSETISSRCKSLVETDSDSSIMFSVVVQ